MPSDQNKFSFIGQLHNFVRTKTQDAYQNLAKGIPGHVSKILENDFLEFTIDATGPYTLPKIQIPQAFSKYHREPTQVGDKGVAVPTDYFIGGESGNDGSTANLYPRGNLTPLTFHPISNKNWPKKDPNMFLVTGGPSGHTTQSADGTTTKVIDNNNNIVDTSSNILSHAAKTIQQIAQTALTHAVQNGSFNLVAQHFTVGAPGSIVADTASPPTPPQPTAQTVFNVIGNIIASGMMAAAGGMGGVGSPGAPPAGSTPAAGSVGEVISVNVTTPVNITSGVQTNIGTITLTPGDWDIQGEAWLSVGAGGATGLQACFSTTSGTFPGGSTLNQARNTLYANFTANIPHVLPLRTGRANVTVNTTYYLIVFMVFPSGTCTATGNLWARRAR